MRNKFVEWFKWFFVCIITTLVVTYGWQGLELLIYGEVQSRLVDTIIGEILILSIVLNIVFISVISKWKDR